MATTKRAPQKLTEEQRQAQVQAYAALKGAGLPVPKAIASSVEDQIAEFEQQREAEERHLELQKEAQAQRIADENIRGPWYVRNRYNAPFNLRLERQTEKKRIELKPRGVPGDMHPLHEDDLDDAVLKQNVNTGLIEIIPAGEAALIVDKQTTNMGQRTHTALAILRNERGEPMEGGVRVEAEYNRQGMVVAVPDPEVISGAKRPNQSGGLTRVDEVGNPVQQPQARTVQRSQFVPTGGNPAWLSFGPTGPSAAEAQLDAQARNKAAQGPRAGIGDLQVVVEPVRRT